MSAEVWDAPSPLEFADRAPVGHPSTLRAKLVAIGLAMSFLFHAWLMGTLNGLQLEERLAFDIEPIVSRVANDVPLPDEDELQPAEFELANPDDREVAQQTTLNAASIGLSKSETPKNEVAPLPLESLTLPDPLRPTRPVYDIPEGLRVDERLVVPGTTGDGIIQLDAALDRVTWEIAAHLREKKVLVVWLLDQSGSLEKQRTAVAKRLKRIYGELDALEEAGQFAKQDRPLLTGVVGFGLQPSFLTKEPTDRFDEIVGAFASLQNDPSGVENVFTAISTVLDRWHKYRIDQGRRILLITVTDEAGDDHGSPLDLAIVKCRRWGALAYVIGPASPFGKRRGFVPYRAPEDGRTYQLPVDLGPESVVVENVELPFWYDGPQYQNISSGYGPYALSRLVRETGGVYFLTNMTTMAGLATIGTYDPTLMKAFEPDYHYSSPQEFLNDMARHPLRAAVFAAARHSQETDLKAAGTPRLEFRLAPNNFRAVFTDAQRSAAVSQLAVDTIFAAMPPGIEKAYATEPSLRWRLTFSLNYGRLLAQKVRALEYNTALAELKMKYTQDDVRNRVNQIILRPDREVNYANSVRKQAKAAEEHLQRVISDAPGTPWAVLAQRELKDGFGIRVLERYIPPPPPSPPAKNQPQVQPKRPKFAPEPKKAAPTTPPPPPPKPVLPKL